MGLDGFARGGELIPLFLADRFPGGHDDQATSVSHPSNTRPHAFV